MNCLQLTTQQCFHLNRRLNQLQSHDLTLYRHGFSVAHLTLAFAAHLGYSEPLRQRLFWAALLHDVGKLELPSVILDKTAPLTAQEWDRMREHPEIGHSMLLKDGVQDEVRLVVARDHHERLDGTGYPRGILAAEIPEFVRLVSICDVFTALTEDRPYQRSFTIESAIARLKQKHTRLDMTLVAEFVAMIHLEGPQGLLPEAALETVRHNSA